MQPIRRLMQNLAVFANAERYLFTPSDLRALFPDLSDLAFKTLLSRAVKENYLERVCRGLYLYQQSVQNGLLLFHAAARLRANAFNYLSLETVLSETGVISQVPMNWISVMSSGRSNVIACGRWGTIEFIHTRQKPEELRKDLSYDSRYKMWKASVALALRDMRATHRSLDLIDWSVANELI
jgi:hypothetical protein